VPGVCHPQKPTPRWGWARSGFALTGRPEKEPAAAAAGNTHRTLAVAIVAPVRREGPRVGPYGRTRVPPKPLARSRTARRRNADRLLQLPVRREAVHGLRQFGFGRLAFPPGRDAEHRVGEPDAAVARGPSTRGSHSDSAGMQVTSSSTAQRGGSRRPARISASWAWWNSWKRPMQAAHWYWGSVMQPSVRGCGAAAAAFILGPGRRRGDRTPGARSALPQPGTRPARIA